MPEGIIIKGIGGFYYVKTGDGVYECKAKGVFRKEGLTPLPGDSVSISVLDEHVKTGNIDVIHKRHTFFIRPAVANIDQIVLVAAAESPVPDLYLLDKLLITAEIRGVKPVIYVNKIDLDQDGNYQKIVDVYTQAEYRVIPGSTKTGSGMEGLKQILAGHVTAFAGQSGVGKSTLLNRIMDTWVMKTGEVSHKLERGKHTTRHAELVELRDGGYVVDTPGFSSFELTDIGFEELEQYYPEFKAYLGKCRFTGCSHISEPDCAVKEALQGGMIDESRYDRYVQLYRYLKDIDNNKWK